MFVVIDYGMGNVGSVVNMLAHIGARATLSADPGEIRAADGLLLPGVGAFDRGMENLRARGLNKLLTEVVVEGGKPLLGICLGMQLITQGSEEGDLAGLGWLEADTLRFKLDDPSLKVPHMGWNRVAPAQNHALWQDADSECRFYFVHSYHVVCARPEDVLCETTYGATFTSGVARGNIFGVQFHPEKSHKYGMQLFRNFVALCSDAAD